MNILVILGSRNPEGQTARAAGALLDGVREAGGAGEMAFLPALKTKHCQQCDQAGWGLCRQEGRCVLSDDFADLVDKARQADLVAFANPVYFSDLSESLRAFLDRLRRICRHATGKEGIDGTPAIGICVAGGGGGGAPACCLSLEKVLQTTGFDVVDMVPVRRQNLDFKLSVLSRTGAWLVEGATE